MAITATGSASLAQMKEAARRSIVPGILSCYNQGMLSRPRGLGLGTVLLVTALLATLCLALSSLSVQHLAITQRAGNGITALNRARSLVNLALDGIAGKRAFGTAGETLELEGAVLTFDESEAAARGVPVSVNSFDRPETRMTPDGARVPPQTLRLVAVAELGGRRRTVEAWIHLPPFPYAVASAGPVRFEGGGGGGRAGLA